MSSKSLFRAFSARSSSFFFASRSSSSLSSASYSSSRLRSSSSRSLLHVADLGADVGLELLEVLVAALVVDPRDDVGGEVDDLLEALRRDVEQVAEAARNALEVPDVRDRGGELDVAHPLAAHLRARDLDATTLTDDALEPDALVLAAVALPVLGRPEDLLAEQAVLLGLERAVVDRLRLLDLAVRPRADLVRGGERDRQLGGVVHVEHRFLASLRRLLVACVWSGGASRRAGAGAARLPRRCPVRAARGRCRATRWCGRRPRRARGSPLPRPPRS